MFVENVIFPYEIPISYEGCQGGSYHLHSHKDVIEILMLIKGKAKVVVSCENFEMDEGDYVVIRESDSHSYSAAESSCEMVSLHIRMQDYLEKIPYLYYVIFACESFDLAKYRNETARIRNMIGSIVLNLIRGDRISLMEAKKGADDLLWLLVNDYDMVKYYNRKWDAPFSKIEKYYVIMGYIFNYYPMRNIREYISQNEFYSKSHITHLFKEVAASSFKDMLDFVRIFRSEEMLLDSDLPINEISERCGYSDIKYYTANFKKWFLCTPSEYRKNTVKEVHKKSIFNRLDSYLIAERVVRLTKEEQEDTQYRAAVTPISVKAFQILSREHMEKAPDSYNGQMLLRSNTRPPDRRHFIWLSVGNEILEKDNRELAAYIESYESPKFHPMVTVDLREMSESKCREAIEKCIEVFQTEGLANHEIYILYNNLGEYDAINMLITEIKNDSGFDGIRPLFMR